MSTHLQGQSPQVIEHVINLGVCQVAKFDIAGRSVDTAGNLPVCFNQQRRDPPGDDRPGNMRQFLVTEILGP